MAITFKHEGGFVDNPDDLGAATNMGITLALYRRAVNPNATVDDIRYLTAEKAASISKNTSGIDQDMGRLTINIWLTKSLI